MPSFWKKTVLLFILAALAWYAWSGMMLHHVYDSPFHYKGADPAYWLLCGTGLTSLLTAAYANAFAFTVLLFMSFTSAILLHRKKWPTITAGTLLLIYQIVFNLKIGYHAHHLFAFQFALFPFYFQGTKFFDVSVAAARLLACATYASAGLFKLKGGAWMDTGSFVHTLQNQHAAYLYFEPDSFRAHCIHILISQPILLWLFFLSAMLLQLGFIAGFFTRRFDAWLAFFILLFHLMDWLLMNLGVFMGMTTLSWLFVYGRGRKSQTGKMEAIV